MLIDSCKTNLKRDTVWAAALLCAGSLAGCAGSSDGDTAEPGTTTPVNSAPVFTSNPNISLPENTIAVTTATAVDADGDRLTYSISGGADASLFSIVPNTGEITFNISPDFEKPDDSGEDNVYNFTVRVMDGKGGEASAAFTVTILNVPDERYIEEVFAETVITDDILYATVNGKDLVLNVITPEGDTETDRPFVLLATGGAFAFTERAFSIPIAERFARAGYVAAVMDYRTRGAPPSGSQFVVAAQEATHDMLGAVRFMRANASTYGIDPDKFVVGGTSAGAYMAVRAGTLGPDDPQTDDLVALLDSMGGIYGNVGDHLDQSSSVQGVYSISGGIFDLSTIDSKSAVVYGVHNELDRVAPCRTVPLSQPELVVSGTLSGTCDFIPAFQVRGLPSGSFIVPGDAEHVDFTDEEWAEFTAEALVLFKTEIIDID